MTYYVSEIGYIAKKKKKKFGKEQSNNRRKRKVKVKLDTQIAS